MSSAETYVTAAYCVIFGLVLLYVVLIALKLQRLQRDVEKLAPRDEDG
jgi:CcmD family protein